MELELRHLRTLCAIADTGSLGRAAAALGFTQPAVSSQLQRIERFFGQELFVRGRVGIHPTPFGFEVVVQARDVLTRAQAIGRRTTGAPCATDRVLRLAATNTPVLPGLVGRARKVLPGLAPLVSSVYSSSEIVALLEGDEVDVAIAVDYPGQELRHSADLARRALVTEPCFVALPADHPKSGQREVALADLADDAWFLTPDDGAGWPGVYYAACEAAGFVPAAVHEYLGDRAQLQRMIADGMGVSMVQATTHPIPGVTIRPLAGTPLWCRYVMVWHKARVSEEVAEALFGAAASAYKELMARAPHFQEWVARQYQVPRA
ncbi:LysR family transcriptional regulator [Streptomyces sp. NPDC051976]|uniref:LysR family transcriptional regulator n=1 Tax=Streptomyces sp. NPDC051976 TaxID=3154947 RepID=UPI00341A7F30